jgi:hypothetical protein
MLGYYAHNPMPRHAIHVNLRTLETRVATFAAISLLIFFVSW